MPRRRKKPWYRARNILIAVAALFAASIGRETYLAVTAKPGQSVNYSAKIAELIESGQPRDVPRDSVNAFDLLNEAIEIESKVQADYRNRFQLRGGNHPIDYSLLMGPMSPRGYPPGVVEEIRKYSRQAIGDLGKTEFFHLLAQAAAARRAARPTPQGKIINVLLPSLGKYRNFARMGGARMYMAHEAGDDKEVLAAFEETLALGRVSAHGSFLIEYLVAIAIDSLALGELRAEIVERPVDEATLVALLAAIDRQPLPPFGLVIEGERLSTLDTIQWTHTDDGRGSGRLMTSSLTQIGWAYGTTSTWLQQAGAWRVVNIGGAAFPSKAATTRKANAFFDKLKEAAEPNATGRGRIAAEADAFVEKLPERYVLLRMVLPALGKSVFSRDLYETSLTGTRLMIAIEVYRHRFGRLPATLDELAPSILPTLPRDPFTGQAFGYRVLKAGEDKDGRPYLVYSLGADLTDNGGNPCPRVDVDAFRLPIGRGSDFVFNMPRTKPEPEEPADVPAPDAAPEPTPATPPKPAEP